MSNPVALVTGGAKRLGANTAKHLHAKGYNLVIHYNKSADCANQLVAQLNNERSNSAKAVSADLSNIDNIGELANEVMSTFGQLDVLINNASSFYPTPLDSLTLTQYQDLVATNMTAPLFLTKACAAMLKVSNGVVINMCDIHAKRPLEFHSAYCMAKAGQQMMTYALANELAPEIRVNGVAPGAIEWPSSGINGDAVQEVLKSIPLQKKGHMNDIAQAIEYLISAPYVTGQILTIDGGRQQLASKGA
ncbi:pteridine reductase [Psychrobium sp. MM17-31]|uniref:pteridine reductase n=1 Tax=Psychrobium sp. MM17-31 TaxID=2917758 RepID=UPI001EF72767|nr:pteridine reductase [Psychrobium sp. MM17-31]MCG7531514.1 pteridine reductase [Psychrobium sp. MM17-31]